MKTKEWYAILKKPFFAPPSWVFGPVWTVLYVIIIVSFGYVGFATYAGLIPVYIFWLFLANIIFNLLYSPLQFGLRSLPLALIDIVLVLKTLYLALNYVFAYAPWVAYVNIPYFLWVTFATILQVSITFMNRDAWTWTTKSQTQA
jgi:benzodiazapine receptor